MNLVLDPHVHLYPSYNDKFFRILYENLHKLSEGSPECALGAILTEREDCNYYEQLSNASQDILTDYSIQILERSDSYLKLNFGNKELILYPGIQINSLEKIELLGLFITSRPKGRLPLKEAVDFILKNGGLPVINWAPGKWTGKRATLIKNYLVREPQSRECLLGISKLLAQNFTLPSICKEEGAEHPLILGSDPLPFKGDEHQAGTVGLIFKDLKDPSTQEVKKRIYEKNYLIAGKRNSTLRSFFRLFQNEVARRL